MKKPNFWKNILREVEPDDSSNREGHAAKVYFNALFGLDFTRSEDNVINAALNYGYGILLSCFNRNCCQWVYDADWLIS